MKITEKRNTKEHFGNIVVGGVFQYEDSIYLKIRPSWEKDNAVNLKTTEIERFENQEVFLLKAELVIRNVVDEEDDD